MKINIVKLLMFSAFLFPKLLWGQSVGSTEGVFNVSDLGAANYSIPIKVPDGLAGLQPNIALVYSSQGGNSPLGMGWSLSGLSVITRVGNTIYHNKKVTGVALTLDDKYALDGSRLIVISGTNGVADSKYHTEIENFKEVTAVGALGNGPLMFTVVDQNGLKYEYGLDDNSRATSPGKTEPFEWYLSRVTDLNGNYMFYEYSKVDGEVVVTNIKYNYLSGSTQAQSEVWFQFGPFSTTPNFSFIAGGKVKSQSRLTKIIVNQRVNGTLKTYRSYTPTYADDFYTHLIKITEKGMNEAEEFLPTEFTYGATTAATNTTSANAIDYSFGNTYDLYSSDFTGDGYDDVVAYPRKFNSGTNANATLQLYKSNGSNLQAPVLITFPFSVPNNTDIKQLEKWPRNYNASFFDYNGDGKADFFLKSSFPVEGFSGGYPNNRDLYNIFIANNGTLQTLQSGGTNAKIGLPSASNATTTDFQYLLNTIPILGDFDGDGKSEILAVKSANNVNNTLLIGENYMTPCTGGTACGTGVLVPKTLNDAPFLGSYCSVGFTCSVTEENQPKVIPIDYNGDGKNEILYLDQGTAKVYELNVTFDANNKPVIGSPSFKLVNSSGYPTIWHKGFKSGDFNGDGITDIIVYSVNAGWEIAYGKGDGTFEGQLIQQLNTLIPTNYLETSNLNKDIINVADFNGDGLSDIYVYPTKYVVEDAYTESQAANIIYSKGGNNFEIQSLTNIQFDLSPNNKNCFGDFNGDGFADLISKHIGNYPLYQFSFHPNEYRHLLSQVKNGIDAKTSFQYKSLTDASVSSLGASNYPFVSRQIPLKVVSRSIITDYLSTTYYYSALKFHVQGKGILGFDKVTSFVEGNGFRQEKNYGLNTTYAFPYLSNVQNTYNPNAQTNTPMSSSVSTYGVYSYGGGRIFPYLSTSTETNALTGETTQITNNYVFSGTFRSTLSQNMGKPLSIKTDKGNGLEITTQTFTFPNYATPGGVQLPNYYYSFASSVTTSNTRINQPIYTRKSNFNYSTVNGLLTSTVDDPGTSNEVKTDFEYDTYRNLTKKIISSLGLASNEQRIVYDASGRYVIETYNASFPNIKTTATYDPLSGLKLTNTDPDGLITTNTYDAFGRIKTEGNNNGSLVTTSYNWGARSEADNAPVPNALYYILTYSNAGAVSFNNFDRLGRLLKSSSKNFQNQWVNTTKTYNAIGQVVAETKPTSTLTNQVVNSSYDVYGRLIKVEAPEGITTNTYGTPIAGTLTVTQKNAANQQTKIKTDASGRKIETTDALGNVMSYIYHSNGNEKTVTALGSTVQSYVYDDYGRLQERQDPNYGSYFYTYNAYGNTLSQKDPKGYIYNFNYDAIGRMFKKVGSDGNTFTYTFDNNTGTNCGKMIYELGPEGGIGYGYGMGERVTSIDYQDGNASLNNTGSVSFPTTTTMTFDALGRPYRKQFSTGAGIQYEYNGYNGAMQGIIDYNSGKWLYRKDTENDYGEVTSYTQNIGAQINTTQSYDVNGLLTGQKTQNGATTIRDYQYNFNPASGNLTSRKDVKYGLEESFQYDNLNRLTNITNPLLNITTAFLQNGNIQNKSDAGVFSYDQANRLSSIENYQNIPTVTQQETYTPFDKVSQITEGNLKTDFRYWPNGERSSMKTTNNGTMTGFRSYAADMERIYDPIAGTDKKYTYIRGPEGDVVAIIANENGVAKNFLVMSDHLGSFTHIINENGTIVEEKSFDAWGRLRNPQTWQPYAANLALGQPSQLFDRGYTGHEHLPAYGIINMNGRLYDPVMGRMFSPDVNIVGGGSLQGYNRYSYALNNPLIYTDPDGKNPLLVAFAVGAAISAITYTANVAYSPESFKSWSWKSFALNSLIGGVSGVASYGIGSAFGPVGSVVNEIGRAGAHGLQGAAFAAATGGNPYAGFAAGALSSGVGSLTANVSIFNTNVGGTLLASGVGGLSSKLAGGNFWKGAAIGAMGHLLNQEMHKKMNKQGTAIIYKDVKDKTYGYRIKISYEIDAKGNISLVDKLQVETTGWDVGLDFVQGRTQAEINDGQLEFYIDGVENWGFPHDWPFLPSKPIDVVLSGSYHFPSTASTFWYQRIGRK